MNRSFYDFHLQDFAVNNLKARYITEPTEIQWKTIPPILEGKDVIGKAKTGTGKTLAYLLPMIEKINPAKKELQMLVLTPSRELSLQVQREAEYIVKGTSILVEAVVEGMHLKRQLDKLKQKPQLIVATPGRLVHIIGLKKIKLHEVKIIALDEVDQMLEQGLKEKVYTIINRTLKDRQLLSFSATLSNEAQNILYQLMKNPIFINLDHAQPIPAKIENQYIVSKALKKTDTLVELLKIMKPQKSLVFINRNENVERLVKELKSLGLSVEGIQTRTKNQERQDILIAFNKGNLKVLVTTDLFTRGMDFQNVTHIFNMDLPLNKIDYLHRAGRTGRMDKGGLVINIVRDREKFIMYKMMKYLNIRVTPIDIIGKQVVPVEEIIREKRKNRFKELNNKKNVDR